MPPAAPPTDPPGGGLFSRLLWSQGWDLAVRLAGIAFAAWLIHDHLFRLSLILLFAPPVWDAAFIALVAARAATLAFLSLFLLLFIVRLRPVAKAPGLWPRALAIIGMVLPASMTFFPRRDDVFLINVSSSVLVAVGYALTLYAFTHLSKSASTMAEARRLVRSGPYRVIRHPVYVFEELAVLGLFLPYASLPTAAIVAAHAVCQFLRAGQEERVLRTAFPAYDEYARTTARIIPGVY
jgi:protein-S-isoprenylcysteine O-methyltransferase Ste14